MRIEWTCPICLKTEKTTSRVSEVRHTHNNEGIRLLPYKKPRKPPGTETIKGLKKEVWDIFSEYIRQFYTDKYGFCECVTCGHRNKPEFMQAGHYLSRKHNGTFIDIRNVHVQCAVCNIFKKGNLIAYHEFMLKRYGEKVIAELEMLAKRHHQFKAYELKAYKDLYSRKLKELDEQEYLTSKGC